MTKIDNFYLAADYVRTYTDLATMEAANEAARRAVNGILKKTGSTHPKCDVSPLEEPGWLKFYRNTWDDFRFRLGMVPMVPHVPPILWPCP